MFGVTSISESAVAASHTYFINGEVITLNLNIQRDISQTLSLQQDKSTNLIIDQSEEVVI